MFKHKEQREITHALLTNMRNHYLIDQEEDEELRNVRLDSFFWMKSGSKIKGSDIAEVLPIREYYYRYPDKAPARFDHYKTLPGLGFERIIRNSRTEVLDQMIIGIKRCIGRGETTGKAEDVLDKMAKRKRDLELETA